MRKTGTGTWKEISVTLSDAHFGNRCPRGTDLMLVSLDQEDDAFHMVQVTRKTGDRKGIPEDVAVQLAAAQQPAGIV